jgi:hypothetical protein
MQAQTRRTALKQRSPAFIFGIVASLVLGFGIVAGIFVGLRSIQGLGYEPDVLQATKTGPNSAELDISTFPDSQVCHPNDPNPEIGWVSYCPSTTFELPPNSTITVVIKQYDSASGLYNDFFQNVQGTIGGVALYNNKPMSQLKEEDIAHTFTLQSPPDSDHPIFVSVPLLGVADNAPNNVTVNGRDVHLALLRSLRERPRNPLRLQRPNVGNRVYGRNDQRDKLLAPSRANKQRLSCSAWIRSVKRGQYV